MEESSIPVDKGPKPEHLAKMAERREALRTEVGSVMPKDQRFVWEIGCGHGHFLTAYAKAHPNQCCLGVDLRLERVERGAKKQRLAELPNLHFIRADARMFLEVLPAKARCTAIYILFPDPWPKKRHHKNRLLKAEFLHEVSKKCERGAPFYFRTDYAPYFEEVVETLRGHPDWELLENHDWPFEVETVFQQRAKSYQSLVALRR